MIKTSLCALSLLTLPSIAAPLTLSHPDFTVSADTTDTAATFTIQSKAGKTIVKDGVLSPNFKPAGPPTLTSISDPLFGKGKRISIPLENGSVSLDAHPSLPFVLIRSTLKNTTTAEIDTNQKTIATFTYDADTPAKDLKAMGTGGLKTISDKPGSYLFLTAADPSSRHGLVAGWISQFKGSGSIFASPAGDDVSFSSQLEHGHLILQPGQSATLDTLAIGNFNDARTGLESLADTIAKSHHIQLRPKHAVYCSWYTEGPDRGRAGTPAITRELAQFIQNHHLQDHGLSVIQLDDGWQDGPNLQGPATEFDRVSPKLHYKDGIAPVAADVEKSNLTFGLWWLPFGRNHTEAPWSNRLDWFFQWPNGKPLRQKGFGGTCLDSTHPEVEKHLETLAKTIRSWGVKYYKMDGLSVGAGVDHVYINDGYKNDRFGESKPPHDRTKTQIEAMRHGLETIRKGAGNDVFFSGCCAVQNMRIYAGSIGLVDSMRVGPDFNHDGQGIRSGPLRGSWVYFLNGKVWWNDPDPTKVRVSNEKCIGDSSITGGVTLEQAQMTSSWASLTNQFFLVSDWLPSLPKERMDILKKTMLGHNAHAQPVDYFDNNLPNTWLISDTSSSTRRDVIGLFNFYKDPLAINHSFEKLGLNPKKSYFAYDFWADKLLPDLSSSLTDSIPANSCKVIAIREASTNPVILSSSRHVTQGMIDLSNEKWSKNTLSATAKVLANEPYQVRIRVPNGWSFQKATAKNAEITTDSSTPGLLRVNLNSKTNASINLSLTFSKTNS